jgi:hypothetical protein
MKKAPSSDGAFFIAQRVLHGAQAGVDFAENAADNRAKDHQSRDNDNCYQNENQRIFNKTLAFFFG